MNPLFFGASARPLFGIYHAPERATPAARGVLLCPAYASEYMRTHWTLRQLAQRLTRAGLHVLRFDYAGTGDSAGERGQFAAADWHADIIAAAEELKNTAGVSSISAVGLRLGALLAATCPALVVDRLILWDPVTNGRRYLETLSEMHLRMLRDLDRFRRPRPNDELNAKDQLLGFPFPAATRDSIGALDLAAGIRADARHVIVLAAEAGSPFIPADVEFEPAAENGEWAELGHIEKALFAPQTIRRIVERLAEAA